MIEYSNQNIIHTECFAIAHGCNMQGKMNSGVAKAIRERYPYAYDTYEKVFYFYKHGNEGPKLGHVIIAGEFKEKFIGNLLTQEFYGRDGKRYASLDAIVESLDWFVQAALELYPARQFGKEIPEKRAIAIPKIGCGLGGLSWDEVEPIIAGISEKYKIDFIVYDNGDKS